MNRKKILVTGGAGYIGSHITKLLIDKGYEVIVIDNLSNGNRDLIDKRCIFFNMDLSDIDKLDDVFLDKDIYAVIHLAAFIEAGESMKDPAKFFRNNVVNTINLLDKMMGYGVKRLIFSSTAAVYGEPVNIPIAEDHPTKPTNYYGLSKLMIEQILESYNKAYGLKFISLRYFNASGADESGFIGEMHVPETHLIPIILDVALGKRDKIRVFGNDYPTEDGTCIRDYIHVNDLAEAHILSMEKIDEINNESFNIGNGEGFSVAQIIALCKEVTKSDINIEMTGRRKGDPAVLVADYSKIKKVLGWQPKRGIKEIIDTAWKWHTRKDK